MGLSFKIYREFKAWRRSQREARENEIIDKILREVKAFPETKDLTRYFAKTLIDMVRYHDKEGIS